MNCQTLVHSVTDFIDFPFFQEARKVLRHKLTPIWKLSYKDVAIFAAKTWLENRPCILITSTKMWTEALTTNAAIDALMIDAEPPTKLPPEMMDAFTYGGKVEFVPYHGGFWNQGYMGDKAIEVESEEAVNWL